MEQRINIAELLKDCPKGMELYSPIFGEVYLDKIRPHLAIVVTTDKEQGDFKEEFLYDGRYGMNGECMLFPSKGKTTWEGFVPPCQFKTGDVIYVRGMSNWIAIYKENIYNRIYDYVSINADNESTINRDDRDNIALIDCSVIRDIRLATEEEKQKLFQAIKDNGYKWNAETKTLEKLPKAKFDINTLIPFESRVLVRDINTDTWEGAFYSHYKSKKFYTIGGIYFHQCIPYESNEHLLGTTDDCDEFYKIW